MLDCQKELFSLPADIHYLSCATMSPLSKEVEAAGIQGLLSKSQPHEITQEHFFDTAATVKVRFAQLINCPDAERIAIMPSVSYGMATVVKNLLHKRTITPDHKVVLVGEEFPSDVYGWDELVQERGIRIETVMAPTDMQNRGARWNEKLLNAIDQNTLLVCISPTHWADGTLFDLEAIGEKCRQFQVFFAIDGTQHIGAFPFDLARIQPDFLICAVYKWLLGPYGNALAYCGPFFDDGFPLEQTWPGRVGSHEFKNLIHYQSEYRPKAFRYNMGEFSNFINLPMISAGLVHLLTWTPAAIQEYAKYLADQLIPDLVAAGYWVEAAEYRAAHLFGIRPPQHIDFQQLQTNLIAKKIYVSYRGTAIRISLNVWNDEADIAAIKSVLLAV